MRKVLRGKDLKLGGKRVITKFLWLPKVINDEVRWLEWASLQQEVVSLRTAFYFDNGKREYVTQYKYKWVDRKWVDHPKDVL